MNIGAFLSDDDLVFLKQWIGVLRNRGINTQNRPRAETPPDTSPAVYTVLTPEDGIPAIAASTDTASLGQPGYASCTILRTDDDGVEPTELYPLGDDRSVGVYNATEVAIPGSTVITAWQDRFGKWQAQPRVGSAGSLGSYIAIAPLGGIPAGQYPGSGSGSGTGTTFPEEFTAGQADCDIYQIIDVPAGDLRPVGTSLTVYNLSLYAIKENTPVVVSQDHYGRWITGSYLPEKYTSVTFSPSDIVFTTDATSNPTIDMAGPVWNITADTTTTIGIDVTWYLRGTPDGILDISVESVNITGNSSWTYTAATTVDFVGTVITQGTWYHPPFPLEVTTDILEDPLLVTFNRMMLNVTVDELIFASLDPTSSGNYPLGARRMEYFIPKSSPYGITVMNEYESEYPGTGTDTHVTSVWCIRTPTGEDTYIPPGTGFVIVYNETDQRWDMIQTSANIYDAVGGDLSGFLPDPLVVGWNGVPIHDMSAGAGRLAIGQGSFWLSVPMSHHGTLAADGQLTLNDTGVSAGTWGDSTHVAQFTTTTDGRLTFVQNVLIAGAPPTGAASGDLGGSYPSPTVQKLKTVPLGTVAAFSGYFLAGTGSTLDTVAMSGDATLSGGTVTLANVGTAGSYSYVTTDSKGRVIAGRTVTLADLGYTTTGSGTVLVLQTNPTIKSCTISGTTSFGTLTTTPIFVKGKMSGSLSGIGAGFGTVLEWDLDSTTTQDRTVASSKVTWVTATDASRKARQVWSVHDTSAREYLRGEASGSAAMIGVLGAAAIVQQTGDLGTAMALFGWMNGTPTFAAANITGILSKDKGGTALDTSAVTNGQLLIGNTTGNVWVRTTITAGSGITVTNGAGTITIAATLTGTVTGVDVTGTLPGSLTVIGIRNRSFVDVTPMDGMIPIGDTSTNSWTPANISSGNGIIVTNGPSSITIASAQIGPETPSGTINGSNAVFTLAHTPVPSSGLIVFRNGVEEVGGTDYTYTAPGGVPTLTFATAPATGDNLTVYYPGDISGSTGTVTSVALATNATFFTVSGSPVTGSGTLTFNLTTGLAANRVLATPDGTTGALTLRALVAADLPNHSAALLTSGTLLAARMPALIGDVTSVVNTVSTTVVKIQGNAVSATSPTNLQVLQWIAANSAWEPTTLTTTSGTVTSVGLSLPTEFNVTIGTVTSSGTLTAAWNDQSQNTVFAAPPGADGTPQFRLLSANHMPAFTGDATAPIGTAVMTVGALKGTSLGTPVNTVGYLLAGTGSVIDSLLMGGDASIDGTGVVTITAGSITYAKMQRVSSPARVLGLKIGSAVSQPEECTLSDVLDFIGTAPTTNATRGTILVRGDSSWEYVAPPGSPTGQVLTIGAGPTLSWSSPGTGTVTQVNTDNTSITGGPITTTGVLSIANHGVTYSKLQQSVNACTVLGNSLATGSHDFAEIRGTSARQVLITDGSSPTLSFRILVKADLPSLSASDLSNTTTGSGAIVLQTSPTIVTPTLTRATINQGTDTLSTLVLVRATDGGTPSGLFIDARTAAGATVFALDVDGSLTAGKTGLGFTIQLGVSTVTGVVNPINGGTGVNVLTNRAVVLGGGGGTNPVRFATVGTVGRVLTDQGSLADPSFATLSALLDAVIGSSPGTFVVRGASTWTAITLGGNGTYIKSNGFTPSWQTAVSSVGVSVPAGITASLFTISLATPSTTPVLTFSPVSQSAAQVYASPAAASGVPSFRSLVLGDLASVANASTSSRGLSPIAPGGETQYLCEDGTYRPLWVAVPSTNTSTGFAGQMADGATYFYLCVADDEWKRIPWAVWSGSSGGV